MVYVYNFLPEQTIASDVHTNNTNTRGSDGPKNNKKKKKKKKKKKL